MDRTEKGVILVNRRRGRWGELGIDRERVRERERERGKTNRRENWKERVGSGVVTLRRKREGNGWRAREYAECEE